MPRRAASAQELAADRLDAGLAALNNPAAPARVIELPVEQAVSLAAPSPRVLESGSLPAASAVATSLPAPGPAPARVAVAAPLPSPWDDADFVAGPARAAALNPANVTAVGPAAVQLDGPGALVVDLNRPLQTVEAGPGADIAVNTMAELQQVTDAIKNAPTADQAAAVQGASRERRRLRQPVAPRPPRTGNASAGEEGKIDPAQVGAIADRILSAPDFGVGGLTGKALREAADNIDKQGLVTQGTRLRRLAGLLEIGVPTAALGASVAVPVMMAAGSGNEAAGGGGGLVQGGTALVGALAGGRLGTPGRLVGGLIGGGIGGAAVGAGRSAVDAANGGDTGLVGGIGRALDPLLDSQREVEERQLRAQLNSPLVRQLKEDERQQRHQQMMDAMQQQLLQSILS